jgi:N-acetylneuraminic acid mutarotase
MVGKRRATLILLLILCFLVITLPEVETVRATEDSWATMEPMPTARSGLGVAVVDGKIYVIGGQNGTALSTNEMYDPITNTWSSKKPMPTPRAYFGITVYQNKIYAIGGATGAFTHTAVNEVYDPLTDTWESKKGIPEGRERFCANVVNDKIYLISGMRNPFSPWDNSDKNYVYDPSNDSWTTMAPIPTAVHDYASAIKYT